jgi:hypothetical protein
MAACIDVFDLEVHVRCQGRLRRSTGRCLVV